VSILHKTNAIPIT
jgi:transposase InsO family protein